MRLRAPVLFISSLLALGLTAPATASTGGTADGERHPNVALILGYDPMAGSGAAPRS